MKQGPATGNQIITGVGFQPKALILLGLNVTSFNTFEGESPSYIGFASSSITSKQRSLANFTRDFDSPTNAICGWRTDAIWNDIDFTPAFTQIATLNSFNADGFTLNWSTNDTLNWIIGYLAFGGTDLTNVDVGSFNAPSSTGSFSVTGVGFRPDFIIFLGTNFTSDDVVSNTLGVGYSFGFANKDGEQAVASQLEEDNVSTTDNARYQRTTRCLAMFSPTDTGTLTHEATIVSMDSNGFTLNFTTASGANRRVAYIAFKGGKYKIGSFTSPTSGATPVSQDITSVGFQPKGLLFTCFGNVAASTIQSNWRSNYGAASSSSSRFSSWSGSRDAVVGPDTASRGDSNRCIRVTTEAGVISSSTTQAEADFTQFLTNGFRLSWPTRDMSNAYQIIYVAFGNAGILYERPVSETVSIEVTDVTAQRKVPIALSEMPVISAVVAKKLTAFRTLEESLTLTSNVTKVKRMLRDISESIAVSDAIGRFKRAIRLIFPIAGD